MAVAVEAHQTSPGHAAGVGAGSFLLRLKELSLPTETVEKTLSPCFRRTQAVRGPGLGTAQVTSHVLLVAPSSDLRGSTAVISQPGRVPLRVVTYAVTLL